MKEESSVQLNEELTDAHELAKKVAEWESSRGKVTDAEVSKAYWEARKAFDRI